MSNRLVFDMFGDKCDHVTMLKIIVYNSECQIEDIDKSLNDLLKNELCYKDTNIEFSYNKKFRYLENLKAEFEVVDYPYKAEVKKKILRESHILNGIKKKLYISLYRKNMFPTGLLCKVESILKEEGIDPIELSNIVNGESKNLLANQLLHSDMDADRMDYLLRDAYYTGVKIGLWSDGVLKVAFTEADEADARRQYTNASQKRWRKKKL